MKITDVDIPALPERNLQAIKMSKLGPMVLIAGPNGAGKTRLLRVLVNWATQQFHTETELLNTIKQCQDRLDIPNHPSKEHHLAKKTQTEELLHLRRWVKLSADRRPNIVQFVPHQLDLIDPNQMAKVNIVNAAVQINKPGMDHLAQGTFARIQMCQDRQREATHPQQPARPQDAQAAIAEYDVLCKLVSRFLGTEITRSIDGEAELFRLPLGRTALSDGQKVILQLCLAIHAQASSLNNLIIFMDEPENHLHPSALLDLVEILQQKIGDGQIWIATHSIPLLAILSSSSLWWMENGSISNAGAKPDLVLQGLLGDQSRRDRLADFLDLPFLLASNRFAAECLKQPAVVAHTGPDPQGRQICRLLTELRSKMNRLRLLDFGAGKGRLAAELAENWQADDRAWLDYVAFDPSTKNAQECVASIARLSEQQPDKRLFNDATKLRESYDEGSFHVVVMCNVLHEILPFSWNDLFGLDGKITRFLNKDGYLLIVEVQQLPYGELAHQHGFIVLDTAQLKKLFSITEADCSSYATDSEKSGWLKAHLISRELVSRFTPATGIAALHDLADTARDRIRELREQPPGYRQGRLHGFWVQQFANAQLALK